MRAIKFALSAAFMLLLAGPAFAEAFPRIWVFGDSSVDAGWYRVSPWSGLDSFDHYLQNAATYGIGKPTTNPGRISVQILAHILGLHVKPQNQSGTDYGTGGARNHETNGTGSGLFPNAVPTETQIDNYVNGHTPNGKALYVVSSGDNDIAYALTNPNKQFGDPAVIGAAAVQANQDAYVVDAAQTLAAKIADAQTNHKVKYVIVTKLMESFGTPTLKKTLRVDYNAALKGKLDTLNVKYAWADVDAVRVAVNASPIDFGINSNYIGNGSGQRACTDPMTGPDPSLAITTGWAFLCSPMSPVTTPISTAVADEAMFADDGHFATGGARVFGSYYYCLAKKTWPTLFNGAPPNAPPVACKKFFPPNSPS